MSPMRRALIVLLLQIPISLSMCPYKTTSATRGNMGYGDAHQRSRTLESTTTTPLEGNIPSATDISDPLVVTNKYFHSMYNVAREELVPKVSMMLESDYLVLHLANGSRLVEPIVHSIFHDLKMVCHIPLGAYSILMTNSSQSVALDQTTVDKLQTYQELLENVTLTEERFSAPGQLDRQIYIYDLTLAFVRETLLASMCSLEQLADFAWSTSATINYNLEEAAEDTINATHAVVMQWKENLLTEADWNYFNPNAFHVLRHMANQEYSIHQYFIRLFGGSVSTGCGESQGWALYDDKAFGLSGHYTTEEMIIKDVSTHYTDYPIGRDFFHDLYRMHRDALADAAKKALDKIFGPEEEIAAGDDIIDINSDSDENNADGDLIWKIIALSSLSILGTVAVVLVGRWVYKNDPSSSRSDTEDGVETKNILLSPP